MPPKYNAPRVALLDSISPTAVSDFESAGFAVETFDKTISPADLSDLAAEVALLGVRSGPEITPEMMGGRLEAIGVFGVGVNHIAIEGDAGANEKNIAVFNSPHDNTRSVAELVIGSSFALVRGLHIQSAKLHDNIWWKENGQELRRKKIGIVGYGVIGIQVSVLAEALNMDVLAYDPQPQSAPQGRTRMTSSLEELLAESDIVTLHTPATKQTRGMIDSKRIAAMKDGAYLINAARAELVDYEALKDAIQSGKLAGAAIDVFGKEFEPDKKGDRFDHILAGVPEVLLTSHIGGSTREAQSMIGATVARKLIDYVQTGNSSGAVNIPNLTLEAVESETTRILNLHKNKPGVVKDMTEVISGADLNLVATSQRAKGEIGYVAFDIEGEVPEDVVDAVAGLSNSRKTKVLNTR